MGKQTDEFIEIIILASSPLQFRYYLYFTGPEPYVHMKAAAAEDEKSVANSVDWEQECSSTMNVENAYNYADVYK